MSDKIKKGPNWGDLTQRCHPAGWRDRNISRYTSRRPLVEESLSIDMRDLRGIYGRKKLLRAADEGNRVSVQLGGCSFQILLTWDSHKLPGRIERWSNIAEGNARVWLVCELCWRKAQILYQDPTGASIIGCRKCLHLVYASENSCKNKWWKQIVKPLKRLYRRREKLLVRKRTRRVIEELQRIEELIIVYNLRAEPKHRTRRLSGIRRSYKDVRMVLGLR